MNSTLTINRFDVIRGAFSGHAEMMDPSKRTLITLHASNGRDALINKVKIDDWIKNKYTDVEEKGWEQLDKWKALERTGDVYGAKKYFKDEKVNIFSQTFLEESDDEDDHEPRYGKPLPVCGQATDEFFEVGNTFAIWVNDHFAKKHNEVHAGVVFKPQTKRAQKQYKSKRQNLEPNQPSSSAQAETGIDPNGPGFQKIAAKRKA